MYTQQEVFRTARPYIDPKRSAAYSFGDGLTHGINEVCRCCKAPAEKIDEDNAQAFQQFYKTKEYKAYKCPACGYMFSWYKN